ncbi:UPF0061 protein YdiU [Bienertia sinuspersici]
MASKILIKALALIFVVSMAVLPLSMAFVSSPNVNPSFPKVVSDLKEAIAKKLGFQADDFKISGFDPKETMLGHSVAYEFDVEIDNMVLPVKLLEDVNRWEYADLPIFHVEDPLKAGEENGLIDRKMMKKNTGPVLAPFQLAGPMELWLQDAKDMRVSLPHDVDAGVLRKVILAEGTVVTVTDTFASGLLSLAKHLRRVSGFKGAPLLSLRVVGPTSLTSPSPSSPSSSNRLKLKRLAPGLVELSSPSKNKPVEVASALDLPSEVSSFLTPDQFITMWPMSSLNSSHSILLGLEKLLSSVLGPKANQKGSFKLLKADVSTQTYLKFGFRLEKQVQEGDGTIPKDFPEWRTKPEKVRLYFEALAKVEGDKVVPEKVTQVHPVLLEDTVAPSVLTGNVTMSKQPIIYQPSNPFTI